MPKQIVSDDQARAELEPLLNASEAARFLSLSTRTLERMRVEGTGPRWTRPSSRRVAYEPSELRKYLAQRRMASTRINAGAV